MENTDLNFFANLIKNGEPIAIPTETVYGLAADVWNPPAIQKVFTLKGRPADNPLIVHIADLKTLVSLTSDIPKGVHALLEHFWPGPLTVVLPKNRRIPDVATAGLDTIAIRMPAHPLTLKLIAQTTPLVAPSANKSGRPSPTKPEHVQEDFGDQVHILHGGDTQLGLESTVLDCTQQPWYILRPGAISAEEIEAFIQIPVIAYNSGGNSPSQPKSPGQKYRHYAPKARVCWEAPPKELTVKKNVLYIVHNNKTRYTDMPHIIHFHGDYELMAKRLYDLFRYADKKGYSQIYVQPFGDELPGSPWIAALKNRIEKASK